MHFETFVDQILQMVRIPVVSVWSILFTFFVSWVRFCFVYFVYFVEFNGLQLATTAMKDSSFLNREPSNIPGQIFSSSKRISIAIYLQTNCYFLKVVKNNLSTPGYQTTIFQLLVSEAFKLQPKHAGNAIYWVSHDVTAVWATQEKFTNSPNQPLDKSLLLSTCSDRKQS